MKHVYGLSELYSEQPSLVTIGVFDGVHRGHQMLIRRLVEDAHRGARQAVVLTLFPHPDVVLRGETGRYYLTTPEQKAELLGALGVDLVVTHPFDESVRQVRAADFVDQLREHLNMTRLWVTADFALGHHREGNFAFLQAQGALKGFEVHALDLLQADPSVPIVISSSGIRATLAAGNVGQAADWLGRPYAVVGTVVHGDHRGRTIGFPTANVETWTEQVLPANGVYACTVALNGEHFNAVTNIGQRPTFDGVDTRVEAHLLDFDRDIYGQALTVAFVAYLRGEQKFSGIDTLVAQIRADSERARTLLEAAHVQNS